jgi:hypothetical protein
MTGRLCSRGGGWHRHHDAPVTGSGRSVEDQTAQPRDAGSPGSAPGSMASTDALILALRDSDLLVRRLEVDPATGSVMLSVGDITARLSVPVVAQWREAEQAAARGDLRLAVVAPLGARLLVGFRANGVPIMAVAHALLGHEDCTS